MFEGSWEQGHWPKFCSQEHSEGEVEKPSPSLLSTSKFLNK